MQTRPGTGRPGYTVLSERIGTGREGDIFLGLQWATGTKVAIKAFRQQHASAEEDISEGEPANKRNFSEWEVAVTSKLPPHPNVIDCMGSFTDERTTYLVMELLEEDLFEYVVRHERIHEAVAKRLFHGVLQGLAHLHAHGIAHHDLKLENIGLSKDFQAKILDFGLSVECDGRLCSKFWGTQYVSAPELLGGTPYDPQLSDVYAFGVMVYVALAGRFPFHTDPTQQFEESSNPTYVYKLDYPRAVSHDARNLVRKCLMQDPATRPSAAELLGHTWFTTGPLASSRGRERTTSPPSATPSQTMYTLQ